MRQTPVHTARRAFLGASRGTLTKVDDSKLMQTVDIGLHAGENKTKVEHPHEYGFTSVPKAADQSSQQQGSGNAGGSGGAGGGASNSGSGSGQSKSAEVFPTFVNGNRSHGIVNTVGDRRFRLINQKEGEVALYDDQTQQVQIARDGVFVCVPKSKKIVLQIMPDDNQQQSQGQGTSAGTGGAGANSGGTQGGSGKQYGQKAWSGQTPLCSFELTKDGFTVKHPKQIKHVIVDQNGNELASHTFDEQGNLTVKTKQYTHTATQVNWNKGS